MIEILVTNDDGVGAKGIANLVRELKREKNVHVTVVAPAHEQSSTAHAITLNRPIRISRIKADVYAVEGTPVDSVLAGVGSILGKRPDFVFSGINRGGNLGQDVHYSGTVSAAVEAGLLGIPAVALSQLGVKKYDYTVAARFARLLLQRLLKNPLPKEVLLNVNVPEMANEKKVMVTTTGKRDYGGLIEKRVDPRGNEYYWIGGNQYSFFDIEGSDCNAIAAGLITVTPLLIDMTSHGVMGVVKKLMQC